MFANACNDLGDSFLERGFEVIAESPRGERGYTLRGENGGQPARGTIFRASAFCGGAFMAGPIVARSTADPEASQPYAGVLTAMEGRARRYPAGYR